MPHAATESEEASFKKTNVPRSCYSRLNGILYAFYQFHQGFPIALGLDTVRENLSVACEFAVTLHEPAKKPYKRIGPMDDAG